jgi:hypothetical protein
VLFSECCLSAYEGLGFNEYRLKTENQIQKGISVICKQAKRHKIRVIFGTHLF